MTIALYPGSFDPATNGHIDIATRAAALFDGLVIGVYDTPQKTLMFPTEARVEMLRKAVVHLPNVRVEPYSELTVAFAKRIGAKVIVRGLRMGFDFEREFEMALMHKKLSPDIEVICLMASMQYQFLSSSLLKEVAQLGGCIDDLVPTHVAAVLREKLSPATSLTKSNKARKST